MQLATHFFRTPPSFGVKPQGFTTARGEFGSVQEAVIAAQIASGQSGNGATEFMIENEAGETVAHLILTGDSWRELNA